MISNTLAILLLPFVLLSYITAHPTPNERALPSTRQISASVFTCDSSNELLNAICTVGLRKINEDLEAAGIAVDRDGILFSFDAGADKKIKTGHSCTVTAKVTHQRASARISSSSRLRFSGNSLIEPFAIRLKLPVSLSARIDIKQRFGVRFLGSCSNTGSDSYSLKASLSTTADAVVGLALNPSLGMLASGDYGFVIEPKAAVLSRLRSTDLKFRVSGVSPITPVLTFVSGFGSTLFKSVTAIFTGDSIRDIIENAVAFDFGIPVLLGVGALPRPIEDVIWSRLLKVAENRLEKKAMGFGPDLEEKLQGDLNRIFKVGPDGKRVFIVKKDIVQLVRQFGIEADVFIEPPVNPAIACEERAQQVCSSPDLAVIYSQCVPLRQECARLRREHNDKYTPPNVIVSRPKIASLPPVRTTPPPTQPPTTRPPFVTDCNPRPGQHVEC